eukprot:TRINITY_DN4144_c0_g1_i1.p3 TRINITY_DN4144_c0_g1~~TRINITY_DN4144_c0_g1_i1.p3  ORF type:complete len:434 (+),score=75.03 TRINITY_DN4144_c0_g1_i1:4410-5711(+)
MILNVSIKEVKGFTKSSLYLIDLAASDRRIKSKKEGKLFTEHTVVSEQLNTLLKVLQSLNGTSANSTSPPYAESHLTRALKDLLSPKNRLIFLGHILQNESAYEETMHTLNYLHKCKCLESAGSSKGETDGMSTAARERLLRKINQENNDLKLKLERIKRVHEKQLDELKRLLGIDIDFEHLTSRRISAKEMEFINNHKKAVEEGDNLEKYNRELEDDMQRINDELKCLHKEYDELQEDRSCQYIILQEHIAKVKAEIKEYEKKKASREQYYENLKNRQAEIVEKNVEQVINEKAVVVGSVKSILQAKEKMAKNTKSMRETQKRVEEKMYQTMAHTNAKNYEVEKELLIKKYSSLIEGQKKEYEKYVSLYQDFRHKKKYAFGGDQLHKKGRNINFKGRTDVTLFGVQKAGEGGKRNRKWSVHIFAEICENPRE